MKNTRLWLLWHPLVVQARRWLRHNDADAIAAYALFHLNRAARHLTGKRYIYALKNSLLRHFYEHGFCVSVKPQKQYAICWDCSGTGNYYAQGDCWKCGGTGIYRTHHLYRFVFAVSGRRYVWHQPQALVTWPVEITEPDVGKYSPGPSPAPPDKDLRELYYVTLHEYLRQRGLIDKSTPTIKPRLIEGLRRDLHDYLRQRAWYWKTKRIWGNVTRLWRTLSHYVYYGEWVTYYLEDEIPF